MCSINAEHSFNTNNLGTYVHDYGDVLSYRSRKAKAQRDARALVRKLAHKVNSV